MSHLIDIKNLSVTFDSARGPVRAVRNVSLAMEAGETLAILGESGSGKSVTASCIMDLLDRPPARIESGEILYRGQDLMKISAAERRKINGRKISMIFQDPLAALNPVYTVGWQIAETMRVHGVADGDINQRVVDLLAKVGIDDPRRRANDYPHQFSGGQRQRIMIASAICLEPDLLIADEPTSALDVTVQAQVLSLLRSIQRDSGMGLLIITHDIAVVSRVADRVVVMNGGQVVEQGRAVDVLHSPSHPYTRRLIDAVLKSAIPSPHSTSEEQTLKPLLSVSDVSKIYSQTGHSKGFRALQRVSFQVPRGRTLGIVGESGSGKSTLARILLGLDTPNTGQILFNGRDLTSLTKREQFDVRRRVQFVFQDPTASLNPGMTVTQIISEPWAIHKGVVEKKHWPGQVAQLLERVGLSAEHASRYPHEFSGGQRQRIAIARALALKPDLIVCDEAVSALDASVRAQIMLLLKELREEFNISYIFIAHDLELVRDFATDVIVMYKGRIVEQGETEQLFQHPQQDYTKDLINASRVAH
jgi:peptide/nickel transport system ATP-binding protein